jgi:hypothetical protein
MPSPFCQLGGTSTHRTALTEPGFTVEDMSIP